MQYTLRDLLLVFVLLAVALVAFGVWGLAAAIVLLGIIIGIRCTVKNAKMTWIFV